MTSDLTEQLLSEFRLAAKRRPLDRFCVGQGGVAR